MRRAEADQKRQRASELYDSGSYIEALKLVEELNSALPNCICQWHSGIHTGGLYSDKNYLSAELVYVGQEEG